MKLRKSTAYIAIVLAFGASGALAGTGTHERDLSVRTDPSVGLDAGMEASRAQAGAGASADIGADVDARVGTPGLEVDPRFDPHGREAKELDADKQTGLERADEVAGEHGQHGRDNAREKQGG